MSRRNRRIVKKGFTKAREMRLSDNEKLVRQARLQAFRIAAKDVCDWCGGRRQIEEVDVHQPKQGLRGGLRGNSEYVHELRWTDTHCDASAIWSRVRHEFGDQAVCL